MNKSEFFVILFILLLIPNVFADSKILYFNQYYQEEDGQPVKFYPTISGTAFRKDRELYFIHIDHLGSTNVITDSNGNEVGRISYYPYGSTFDSEGDIPTEKKFTGQVEDDSTELYYYVGRYYNPETGNFIFADSVGGGNRYAYAENNPLVYTDPTGHVVDVGDGGGGTYLPMIMKDYYKGPWISAMPKFPEFNRYVSTNIGIQKVLIDFEKDPKLRAFIEEGVREISLRMKFDKNKDPLYLYELVSQYVYEEVPYSVFSLFKHLIGYPLYFDPDKGTYTFEYHDYTPLGEFVGGGVCFEKSLLTYVLLKTLDPDIDAAVVVGKYDEVSLATIRWLLKNPDAIKYYIDPWTFLELLNIGRHAWMEVNLPLYCRHGIYCPPEALLQECSSYTICGPETFVIESTQGKVYPKEIYDLYQRGYTGYSDIWRP